MPPQIKPKAKTKKSSNAGKTQGTASPSFKFPQAPSLLNRFQAPSKSQEASPLLRLPGELRIKIFRYLLKNDKIMLIWKIKSDQLGRAIKQRTDEIWADFDKRRAQALREHFMFSAQLLACCQQTYQEGRHVLYKENIIDLRYSGKTFTAMNLEIEFDDSYENTMWCMVLDSLADDDLMLKGRAKMRGYEAASSTYRAQLPKTCDIVQAYPAIASFDDLSITLRSSNQGQLFAQCRTLQSLLRGKKVTMNIKKLSAWGDPVPSTWLTSCRILRCSDIRIASHTGPKVEKLCATITSDESVVEEYAGLKYAQRVFDQTNDNKDMITAEVKREYRLLKSAFLNGNKRLIIDHRKKFSEAAEAAVESWCNRELEAIKKRKRETKANHERMMKLITEF